MTYFWNRSIGGISALLITQNTTQLHADKQSLQTGWLESTGACWVVGRALRGTALSCSFSFRWESAALQAAVLPSSRVSLGSISCCSKDLQPCQSFGDCIPKCLFIFYCPARIRLQLVTMNRPNGSTLDHTWAFFSHYCVKILLPVNFNAKCLPLCFQSSNLNEGLAIGPKWNISINTGEGLVRKSQKGSPLSFFPSVLVLNSNGSGGAGLWEDERDGSERFSSQARFFTQRDIVNCVWRMKFFHSRSSRFDVSP